METDELKGPEINTLIDYINKIIVEISYWLLSDVLNIENFLIDQYILRIS